MRQNPEVRCVDNRNMIAQVRNGDCVTKGKQSQGLKETLEKLNQEW